MHKAQQTSFLIGGKRTVQGPLSASSDQGANGGRQSERVYNACATITYLQATMYAFQRWLNIKWAALLDEVGKTKEGFQL